MDKDHFSMNLREKDLLEITTSDTGTGRKLGSLKREIKFLEIDCHVQANIDEDSRCIKDWNSTKVNEEEIEVFINFIDPISLSQGDE